MPPCQHLQAGTEFYHNFNEQNEQKRKLSYDEDVYDYELSDDDDEYDEGDNGKSVDEEFDAEVAYLQLKRYAARQRKSKDVTPESDYASESNYPLNEVDEETNKEEKMGDDDDGDDDDGLEVNDNNICDMYEKFNLSVHKTPSGHAAKEESDVEEEQEVNDDDNDFLTATFTWNLPNKHKLQINGRDNDNANLLEQTVVNSVDPQKSLNVKHEEIEAKSPEHKLDKLERSWPWADREKIIYKQSTCHLVPHKPLGLIEQRIQLLAKRNLLEHLNTHKNAQ